ncbi:methylation-associated defense system protein MAD4 [Kitasatospora purpeofusca]|uniref:methylation-associated defense system protein MAD4 n=1 Tax=Kitasatospora purpeofusca TaxID=67352 RepID=UPI003F5FD4DC
MFLVADGGMKEVLAGYLGRSHAHRGLGCAVFDFDPEQDVTIAPGRDSDVYRRHSGILTLYQATHRRAVVMVDEQWEGSPGAPAIAEHIERGIAKEWAEYAVIVLQPELEAWLWQDNPNVAKALRCPADFREILAKSKHWPEGMTKPADPKGALEHLKRHHRADQSNAAFRRLASAISVKGCIDPAFHTLRKALCTWFPETTYS